MKRYGFEEIIYSVRYSSPTVVTRRGQHGLCMHTEAAEVAAW